MKNHIPRERLRQLVYGEQADHIDLQNALPLHVFVDVDFQLPGCPIEKHQFFALIGSLLRGDLPEFPQVPVCSECKMQGNECLLVHKGEVCCGTLTLAGCGARCPSLNVPCIGCHGPVEEAHYDANYRALRSHNISKDDIQLKLGIFASPAWLPKALVDGNNNGEETQHAKSH